VAERIRDRAPSAPVPKTAERVFVVGVARLRAPTPMRDTSGSHRSPSARFPCGLSPRGGRYTASVRFLGLGSLGVAVRRRSHIRCVHWPRRAPIPPCALTRRLAGLGALRVRGAGGFMAPDNSASDEGFSELWPSLAEARSVAAGRCPGGLWRPGRSIRWSIALPRPPPRREQAVGPSVKVRWAVAGAVLVPMGEPARQAVPGGPRVGQSGRRGFGLAPRGPGPRPVARPWRLVPGCLAATWVGVIRGPAAVGLEPAFLFAFRSRRGPPCAVIRGAGLPDQPW